MEKAIDNSPVAFQLFYHFSPSLHVLKERALMARKKKSDVHGQK
jgi:hypothetical protein